MNEKAALCCLLSLYQSYFSRFLSFEANSANLSQLSIAYGEISFFKVINVKKESGNYDYRHHNFYFSTLGEIAE